MAKEKFSRTKACATKTLYAVMKEMVRRGGSIPAKEIYPWVNGNVVTAVADIRKVLSVGQTVTVVVRDGSRPTLWWLSTQECLWRAL